MTSSPLDGLCISSDRHDVLLAHQGPLLETWFTEASFELPENTQSRGQGLGCRAGVQAVWTLFLPSAHQPRAPLWVFIWGRTQYLGYFHCVPQSHTQQTKPVAFCQRNKSLWRNFSTNIGMSNLKSGGTETKERKNGEERSVTSQSLCALGRMIQEPPCLLLWIQVSTAAAAGTWKQRSSSVHTLQVHLSVCLMGRRQSADTSRHIVVLIWTVFVSLHIVSVYKWFNPLFQISRLEKKNQNPTL